MEYILFENLPKLIKTPLNYISITVFTQFRGSFIFFLQYFTDFINFNEIRKIIFIMYFYFWKTYFIKIIYSIWNINLNPPEFFFRRFSGHSQR